MIRKYENNKCTPKVRILGVEIATLGLKEVVDFISNSIYKLKGKYICVTNVHTVVTAFEDESYRVVQNSSVLTVPDGAPLVVIGRKKGYKHMERTPGPDLMEKIFESGLEKGWSHYFYGSTQEVLELMIKNIKKKYDKINISGYCSPPFRKLTTEEDNKIVREINILNPDFVWVGLGAPKQEIWMNEHEGLIHSLMIGVGAGFDYYAETIHRAPKWMQKMCLEWFYRLIQDPKRLFRRYLITNTKFIWYIITNRN